MRAGQIVAHRSARIIEVPEPELDGKPGMIKVRVQRACLCGSDSPWFGLDHGDDYPLPVGESMHECIGTVTDSTSDRFQVGDFVLAVPFNHGGLCDYFVTDQDQAVHVPRDAMPLDQLLIAQPLGTVIWACQKLPNLLHADVVVVGQGPIGLLFTSLLSNMGARRVIAMDKLDYRLEVARSMHATHTINVDREDAVQRVQEITGGKMADVVVEAVGHQLETIGFCAELVRRLGTLVAFGVPDQPLNPLFPYWTMFQQNLTVIGSVRPAGEPCYGLARDMILQGRIDVSSLITHVLPLSQIQRAYELVVDYADEAIKVVVDYDAP